MAALYIEPPSFLNPKKMLLLLSIVRDHVELQSEQPLRRPADWDALVRRINGRVKAVLGPNERAYLFLLRAHEEEWVPLEREAWPPTTPVARLRVHLVPHFK
jgi:hypothetical protein